MNVASLELCKRLYELSGWGDVDFVHQSADGQNSFIVCPHERDRKLRQGVAGLVEFSPAYDLGYLLRKLQYRYPGIGRLDRGWRCMGRLEDMVTNSKGLVIAGGALEVAEADTPEDAAAKVAIELFNQGVLKRGEA